MRKRTSDETICDAAKAMALNGGVLPVADTRNQRLVGMVTDRDIAPSEGREAAGETVAGISRHGGPHSRAARP